MLKIKQIEQNDAIMELDGRLCAAARALLGWSQDRLRIEAGIARRTLSDFESETRRPHPRILRDIVDKFYSNGISLVKTSDGKVGLLIK